MSARVEPRSIDWSRYAVRGLLTVLAAVAANVVVYFIGAALIGYDPEFIVLSNVSGPTIFTVVPAIIAVLLYAVLLRFTRNPARIFTIVAAIVLALSVIPDFTYIPTVPAPRAHRPRCWSSCTWWLPWSSSVC